MYLTCIGGCLSKCLSVSCWNSCTLLPFFPPCIVILAGCILDSSLWTVCVWYKRYCQPSVSTLGYSGIPSPYPYIPEIPSPVSYPCMFPLTFDLTLIGVNYLSLTILCAPCVWRPLPLGIYLACSGVNHHTCPLGYLPSISPSPLHFYLTSN